MIPSTLPCRTQLNGPQRTSGRITTLVGGQATVIVGQSCGASCGYSPSFFHRRSHATHVRGIGYSPAFFGGFRQF